MKNIHLSIAVPDYDHVRDFLTGKVIAEGIEITALDLPVEEIFFRFTNFREWDISEMSFGKYVSLVSQNDDSIIAIPVFLSRMFRQSSIYVRSDSPLKRPEDMRGKRVGIPEWAQTASIYTRGYLAHEIGIPLAEIDWYQAGVNQAGRVEKVKLQLPEGVRYTSVPERSLTEMLLTGDLDAICSARPPTPFTDGRGDIVRLIPDYRPVEESYWRKTGIFPIMHLIAIRKDVLRRHPWVAMELYKALEKAKDRSVARAREITASFFPVPWFLDHAERAQALFGDDLWPYGIEPNRQTLEAFLQFAFEQGVCHRKVEIEELFPKEVLSHFRV